MSPQALAPHAQDVRSSLERLDRIAKSLLPSYLAIRNNPSRQSIDDHTTALMGLHNATQEVVTHWLAHAKTLDRPAVLEGPGTRDFRAIVIGDRNWKAKALAAETVRRLKAKHGAQLVIVHGQPEGIVAAIVEEASAQGVRTELWPASTDEPDGLPGRAMIDHGADTLLALHRSLKWSKRTRVLARLAIERGLSVWLVDNAEAHTRRLTAV